MNMKWYYYKLYDLTIASTMRFLHMHPGEESSPDVIIRYGKTPAKLAHITLTGVRFQAGPGQFLLRVDNVANYFVRNGTEIIIEKAGDAEDSDVELFLFGSAIGALMHQRNLIPVHGSAIEVEGKAVVFTGNSGTGKSTLAASFMKRGYRVVTDDISVISFSKMDGFRLLPGHSYLKLWADAIEILGDNTESYSRLRRGMNKYKYPLNGSHCSKALSLSGFYFLGVSNENITCIDSLETIEKSILLMYSIYRGKFRRGMDHETYPLFLKDCTELSKQIDMKNVTRPRSPRFLEEFTEQIEQDFLL